MKTILRIILILLVASVVAGAFCLAVNKNSSATSALNDGRQPPAFTATNGQQVFRAEGGDRDGGSIAGGLGGVLATILKITGITVLVIALQKAYSQISSRNWKPAQR